MTVPFRCSACVTSIAIEAGSPGMDLIGDRLLAAALSITSKEKNDIDMALHVVHVRVRVLGRLRTSCTKFMAGEGDLDSSMPLVAALTNAASEILAHKSREKFAAHLLGVIALIEIERTGTLRTAAAQDNYLGKFFCIVTFDSVWENFAGVAASGAGLALELAWCQSTAENLWAGEISVVKVRSNVPNESVVAYFEEDYQL